MGAIVRQLHDASASFALSRGEKFSFGPAQPLKGHVVCHGDLGPWNVVICDGRISGIIDWDFAHFGDPLEDVLWLALDFAPLRDVEVSAERLPTDFARSRLTSLCEEYRGVNPDDIISAAPSFLMEQANQIRRLAAEGNKLFAQLLSRNIPNELERDATYIREHFR